MREKDALLHLVLIDSNQYIGRFDNCICRLIKRALPLFIDS